MGATIFVNEGINSISQHGTGNSVPGLLTDTFVGHIRLFQNNPSSISKDTVLSDLTESSFTGYGALPLGIMLFTAAPFLTGVNVAKADYQTFTFNCSGGGGQLVYGWYITFQQDPGSGPVELYMLQRYAAPFNMLPGGSITLPAIQYLAGMDH